MTDRTSRADPDNVTVPLYEERAVVEKRDVTTGRVRVATHTESFDQMVHAELESEAVEVTRVAVGQQVLGALPQIRTEGDLTIIPILEEVVFVEKRLMLKEEIHVRKRRTSEDVDVPVALRRQRADVERSGPPEQDP